MPNTSSSLPQLCKPSSPNDSLRGSFLCKCPSAKKSDTEHLQSCCSQRSQLSFESRPRVLSTLRLPLLTVPLLLLLHLPCAVSLPATAPIHSVPYTVAVFLSIFPARSLCEAIRLHNVLRPFARSSPCRLIPAPPIIKLPCSKKVSNRFASRLRGLIVLRLQPTTVSFLLYSSMHLSQKRTASKPALFPFLFQMRRGARPVKRGRRVSSRAYELSDDHPASLPCARRCLHIGGVLAFT